MSRGVAPTSEYRIVRVIARIVDAGTGRAPLDYTRPANAGESIVRLTSLRIKRAGQEGWAQLAVNQPEIDIAGMYVKLFDELPVQAILGAELDVQVRWVTAPADDELDDEDDVEDDAL